MAIPPVFASGRSTLAAYLDIRLDHLRHNFIRALDHAEDAAAVLQLVDQVFDGFPPWTRARGKRGSLRLHPGEGNAGVNREGWGH